VVGYKDDVQIAVPTVLLPRVFVIDSQNPTTPDKDYYDNNIQESCIAWSNRTKANLGTDYGWVIWKYQPYQWQFQLFNFTIAGKRYFWYKKGDL
jgi:hypothetical protein